MSTIKKNCFHKPVSDLAESQNVFPQNMFWPLLFFSKNDGWCRENFLFDKVYFLRSWTYIQITKLWDGHKTG